MRRKPKVSVIMPVYNGAEFVGKAIESVRRQTFRDWELIIIDDASRDLSDKVIHSWRRRDSRIRVMRNSCNRGLVYSLNRGLSLSRGTYIARIDHDDEWVSIAKLEKQLKLLERSPGLVLVGTGVRIEDREGDLLRIPITGSTDAEIRRLMLFRNPFIHPAVMFRKSVLRKTGFYSKVPGHVEDYHLWLEMGKFGTMANLPGVMVRVVELDTGISRDNFWRQYLGCIKLVWKYRNDYPHGWLALFKNLTERFLGFLYRPFKRIWTEGLR